MNNIDNGTMFIHRVYELPGDSVSTGQNAAVTDSAFLLPINGSAIAGDILDWEAYG
ncbi:hypothetical protein MT997_10155 [Paenibacillus sp. OVF10]|nr:hypothetical protein MT997_10155 [Paenibacillus sp. OVF10]